MSINARMKKYDLLVLEEIESPSGAKKKEWKPQGDLSMAVYKISEYERNEPLRQIEASHFAVSAFKRFDRDKSYRMKGNGRNFELLKFDSDHRLCQLTLKEVIRW